MNITGTSSLLGNIQTSLSRNVTDSKNYEGFQVKVGAKSSPDGIVGGVLSQKDYDAFKAIADTVNVNDASKTEMNTVIRSLLDAGLLKNDAMFGFLSGPSEFDGKGTQINIDVKYNQQEYQRQSLPLYADPQFNQTRDMARDAFKAINAIAKASSLTGATVSSRIYAQSDIDSAASQGVKVDLSELGKKLAAGDETKDTYDEIDIALLLMQLEQAKAAQEASEAAASPPESIDLQG